MLDRFFIKHRKINIYLSFFDSDHITKKILNIFKKKKKSSYVCQADGVFPELLPFPVVYYRTFAHEYGNLVSFILRPDKKAEKLPSNRRRYF